MRELLRALPLIGRAVVRLAADPTLPRAAKIALGAAALYLASPFDLLPDVIPFLGYVDDVLLVAIVLDGVLNYVDRALVLRYWPGSPESLEKVARVARVLAIWVPTRVKARIFAPRGQ
ncbi:MAG: YkvA family protein [Candidatus Rokuibacteriota bacterium]